MGGTALCPFIPENYIICKDTNVSGTPMTNGMHDIIYRSLSDAIKEKSGIVLLDGKSDNRIIDDILGYSVEHNTPVSCTSCGLEIYDQKGIDDLRYSRSTSGEDYYYCPHCNEESIFMPSLS